MLELSLEEWVGFYLARNYEKGFWEGVVGTETLLGRQCGIYGESWVKSIFNVYWVPAVC